MYIASVPLKHDRMLICAFKSLCRLKSMSPTQDDRQLGLVVSSSCTSSRCNKRERVPRNHQFFVGRHYVKSDLAVRVRNNQTCRVICGRVTKSAQPNELFS